MLEPLFGDRIYKLSRILIREWIAPIKVVEKTSDRSPRLTAPIVRTAAGAPSL